MALICHVFFSVCVLIIKKLLVCENSGFINGLIPSSEEFIIQCTTEKNGFKLNMKIRWIKLLTKI